MLLRLPTGKEITKLLPAIFLSRAERDCCAEVRAVSINRIVEIIGVDFFLRNGTALLSDGDDHGLMRMNFNFLMSTNFNVLINVNLIEFMFEDQLDCLICMFFGSHFRRADRYLGSEC